VVVLAKRKENESRQRRIKGGNMNQKETMEEHAKRIWGTVDSGG